MLNEMKHIIRPARRNDLPELSRVITAAFETYRGAVPDSMLDLYIQMSTDIGSQTDHGVVMVLELGGRIVGGVVYYADAGDEGLGLPEGWAGMRTLVIHPDMRGRGFGRSLVDHCVDRARTDGVKAIALHTTDFMKDAVAIYRSVGFVRCSEFDLKAVEVLALDEAEADILVTAYKLAL